MYGLASGTSLSWGSFIYGTGLGLDGLGDGVGEFVVELRVLSAIKVKDLSLSLILF